MLVPYTYSFQVSRGRSVGLSWVAYAENPTMYRSSLGKVERMSESSASVTFARFPDSSFAGSDEYVFKHNREREMIHNRARPSALKRYHQAIADWLERMGLTEWADKKVATLSKGMAQKVQFIATVIAAPASGWRCE